MITIIQIVITSLLLLMVLYIPYKIYEPKIDIVIQPKKKVVLLWYNLYIDNKVTGYTGKSAYKQLLTI